LLSRLKPLLVLLLCIESDGVVQDSAVRRNRVVNLEGHLKTERLDAVPLLWP